MGGPSKSEQDRQRALTDEQTAVGRDWLNFAKEDRAKRDTLMDPVLKRNEAILKDRDSALQATAPQIAEFDKQFEQANKTILEDPQMSGAVKDAALAENSRAKASAIARFLNDAFMGAMGNQSTLASGYGNFSMGESGTGLKGYGQAMDSNNMLMQQQANKWASILNFGGQLAGAGATAFAGRKR
jgi:hypothetical protein